MVCDVLPVLNRGPTERIGADVDAGLVNSIEVYGIAQIVAICAAVVVTGDLVAHLFIRFTTDTRWIGEQLVGAVSNPTGGVRIGRATVRWVVFESAMRGGLCEGVTTMPSAWRPSLKRL